MRSDITPDFILHAFHKKWLNSENIKIFCRKPNSYDAKGFQSWHRTVFLKSDRSELTQSALAEIPGRYELQRRLIIITKKVMQHLVVSYDIFHLLSKEARAILLYHNGLKLRFIAKDPTVSPDTIDEIDHLCSLLTVYQYSKDKYKLALLEVWSRWLQVFGADFYDDTNFQKLFTYMSIQNKNIDKQLENITHVNEDIVRNIYAMYLDIDLKRPSSYRSLIYNIPPDPDERELS